MLTEATGRLETADHVDLNITGMTCAACATRIEKKVAMIDSRPFSGTCALRGCDPKKVLVGAAEAIDWIQRMKGRGIR